MRNSSLQLAELEQQKADEDFMKLAEDQKVCWHMYYLNHHIFPCRNLRAGSHLFVVSNDSETKGGPPQ